MNPLTRGGIVGRPARSLQWRLSSSSAPSRRPPHPREKPSRVSNEYKPRPPTPSSPPPPSPDRPETVLALWRSSWLPLSGAAVIAGLLGFYVVGTAAATLRSPSCGCGVEHTTPTGRPPALSGDNAEQFDKELDLPEWWMGITSLRRTMAARATGHVLELAMGSGRNLEYYNWDTLKSSAEAAAAGSGSGSASPVPAGSGVTSFTGLDISADMLDVARRKLVRAVPPMRSSAPVVHASTMPDRTGGQLSYLDDRLRLVNSDAHKPLPPPSPRATAAAAAPDRRYYDTIIQTFGLCSVSDPVAVICNLASAVRPGTGRVVLLEHGRSWFGLVNGMLDRSADRHFAKYGCWWNRDIQDLVDEAVRRTPGLEVVEVQRPNLLQMGTLVRVELRVRPDGGKDA